MFHRKIPRQTVSRERGRADREERSERDRGVQAREGAIIGDGLF